MCFSSANSIQSEAEVKPPENVLFVCKLNPVTEDEDLHTIFSRFGTVVSADIICDYKTGDSLCYAFIEFEDKEACEQAYFKAIEGLVRQPKEKQVGSTQTDNTSLEGSECLVGLECLLNVVRALGMGSCLSAEATGAPPSPNGTSASLSLGKRKNGSRSKSEMQRNSSFELKREALLHRIPGRRFLNGSSDVASMFTKQGKKGINQDAMICWENFGSKADTIFCGVFDGHGPFGHLVSKRVRDSLPLRLSAQWELKSGNKEGLWDISSSASGSVISEEIPISTIDDKFSNEGHQKNEDCYPEIFETLKESFLKAFKVMDKELKFHSSVNCFFSGTTAVTLVKKGNDLVIGNVGDSRAVLGTRDGDNSITPLQLTVDLKPNLPGEEERIKKCKGRVFALPNEPEVARVWLPNNHAPGLAMARAFGDFCLKDYGLISVPEISYHRVSEKDEFVVLATDGVWDVLSNKEVVEIVASVAHSSAARTLVETAVKAWRCKYPTSRVDDCAAICLFFDSNSCTSSSLQSSSQEHTS